MQSVSPRGRIQLATGFVAQRTRESISGGVIWSAILVFLLTYAVARSTATAAWVPGIDSVTGIALGAVVLMGVLAVLPVPWPAALGLGMLAGPVVAGIAASPTIHSLHPSDPMNQALVGIWWSRIVNGTAATDTSFYLFLICWLMWVTGAWLSWCVLRWRKPMLGLIPGAAAFATNLLNDPVANNQNGYNLAVLVLTLALLLWTNYTGSIASATRARVKLTGDARWDFWESGLVAMGALIIVSIMLPPLSTVDRTVQMESSAFSRWAQLQQQLSHPGVVITGPGGVSGTTGFVTNVPLGGALKRTRDPVFTYTVSGQYAAPRYFRGVNVTLTVGGEWRYPATVGLREPVHKNVIPQYGEQYQTLATAGFNIRMQRPPNGNADILFYPGVLYYVDRETIAQQVLLPLSNVGTLVSIDRLSNVPPNSTGPYKVQVEYSTATVEQLWAAGTNYPDWLQEFSTLPGNGYRSAAVINKIHQLALKTVSNAGAVTPYDKATAIEAFLRTNYTYNLNVQTPPGRDPLDYFLFDSKQGYCEYFASAMGDMLRSLGIPTRLINGFGPGQFDQVTNTNIVRGEDAHTWVESYFPGYGWISFEPTNDGTGTYSTIPRGVPAGSNPCLRDNRCDVPPGSAGPSAGLPPPVEPRGPNDTGVAVGSRGFTFRLPDAATLTKIAGIVLAVLLLLLAAAARYLRPRTVMGVWKRTLALSGLAGAERRPGETPLELGRRLQRTFPEASGPVDSLAQGFVVSAYAAPDMAPSARSSVMDAWSSLRPMLLRRVFARFRPNRH